MKSLKLLISLFLIIIGSNLSAQTRKSVEANPINVAVMLMQRTDTSSIASALRYYGYEMHVSQPADGSAVYTHPNGSTIRYKYVDPNQPFPTVEVTSKVSAKEDEQILQGLRFEKTGNTYEQKSIGYITRCQFGPHRTLILTRVMKQKE